MPRQRGWTGEASDPAGAAGGGAGSSPGMGGPNGAAGSSGGTRPRTALGPLRVAATYIGTVVGAGFASGQEILRFFTAYDGWGTLGLLGVAALLAAFGVAIMRLGAATGAESHQELVRAAGGRWLGALADWVITGFLFAGTAVMIAGSNAIFREQFGWPGWLGGLAMAAAATVTVLFRLRGVTAVTSLVAPVLMVGALGVSAGVLVREGWPATPPGGTGVAGAAPFWPLAAMLYASFNLLLAMPVLAPLGAQVQRPSTLHAGGLLGGAGLGLAALALHLAVWAGLPATARVEVPMLALARGFGPVLGTAYAVILWLEVFTTAVTSLYGVAARLRSPERTGYATTVLGLGGVAFAGSFVGFANLVTRVYPLVGYLGLLVMVAVAWRAVPLLLTGRESAQADRPAKEPDRVPAGAPGRREPGGVPAGAPARRGPERRPAEALTSRPLREHRSAPVPVPALGRALARATAAAGVLWGGAHLTGGTATGWSVPELGLWLAAGTGLALIGALADRLRWAAVLGAGARTSLAAAAIAFLLEFGLGSLWLATTGSAAGAWLGGDAGSGSGAPAAPDPAGPGRAGPSGTGVRDLAGSSPPAGVPDQPLPETGDRSPPARGAESGMPGAWWLEAPSAGLVPPEAAGADSLPSPAWTGDLPAQASLTWSTALLAVVAGTAAPVVMAGLARRRSGGAPPSPP
ncbi:hypothetical protein [Thermaerobacter composti]|uniref:Membrane protein YkvI n=1 Tax=Thermaerobacter composti TaxID=554949 RepID=A0ABZ0QSW9_9FIRM|nr:hypothetical protein [Thermaerobacter composti]WPD19762.1 hypothetical protein Q5761_03615 [Thermaerobacter composti]